MQLLPLLVSLLPAVYAVQVSLYTTPFSFFSLSFEAPAFVPPSLGPLVASANYVGSTNGTLPKSTLVAGKQFDRFIQVQ